MNVSETKSEGLLREYQIVITAAEIDAEVSKKLEEIATTVKMPGFRPGKVPMSVVKSRFSDQVRGDAIKSALDEGARQAIEGNDLRLASQPQVDIKSYEDGKDLEASFACEVMPAITLPDLGKVSVDRPKVESDPKEVEETLGRIADENRPTAPLAKARAAKLGDVAMIDFIGRIDGEAFEGGTAEGHSLELGSNSFIPGFEEGLAGAKPGTTIDVPVTFPEDYQAAHLAGKLAVFEVKVNELHEKADASIDDELATRLGFENLDGLKGAIAEQINGQHQTALRQLTKKNVLDALAKGDAFDVPPSLFKQEYDSVARAMNPNAAEQDHDQDHDDNHPAADEGMDDDAKAEAESVATRRVRLGLLVTEIGRENNIEVTEEDTRRAVLEEARRYPGQEQMVLEYFQKNPQAMQQIAGPIFEDKVIDFILEMAKVTDVTIDTDTLYDVSEEAAPAKKTSSKKTPAKKSASKKSAAKKAAAKKPAAKK
ncbi:trigger factor [Alphaproteobacteria bacterium]|nr:trigger factor [Alphaproteobacteria bacterium]MDB2469539.1 trigger factor [Alphaproteobacteria bacterium]